MDKGEGLFCILLGNENVWFLKKHTKNDKCNVGASIAAKAVLKMLCLLMLYVYIYLLIDIRNRCIFIMSSVSIVVGHFIVLYYHHWNGAHVHKYCFELSLVKRRKIQIGQ